MAEYIANGVQTINPGETVIFDTTAVPCTRGFIRHRDGTGNFIVSGWMPTYSCRKSNPLYLISFSANIAIPEGQTVDSISVALTIDGATLPSSTMIQTPAAVGEYSNISVTANAEIFRNCCETFSVRNTSSIPILMQNANLVLDRKEAING